MYSDNESKASMVAKALSVRNSIRTAYQHAKAVQQLLVLYSSNSTFKTVIDGMYTANELTDLGNVGAHFQALVQELESNHSEVIQNG